MQKPNMAIQDEMARYWTRQPEDYDPSRLRQRVRGKMELKFAAPPKCKIQWVSLGGFFVAHRGDAAPSTGNEIWYAINDSNDWKQIYSADVPSWNDHWHYAIDKEVVLDEPAESIRVRYAVRMNLHSARQNRLNSQAAVVTHGFEIAGQLVQRRFAFDKPSEYTIDCDKKPTNVFVQITVPSDSVAPSFPPPKGDE